MKTIFLVVPSLGIGGQERIAVNTAMCLRDRYKVKLIVFQSSEVEYDYPCEVVNINQPSKRNKVSKFFNQLSRIFKVARLRNKEKADAVISFGNSANITNAFSGFLSRGKTVSAIHGFGEMQKNASLRAVIALSDKVICIAKEMQEGLLAFYPKAKNTVVIENGYDVKYIIEKREEKIDEEYPSPAIIAMGRLDPVKGFDRLIKAFAIVKKARKDLNLVFLGKGSLLDELIGLAEREGVNDSVHFLGCHSNPFKFLKMAQIFVMSSRNEGFPNALIEALACELPIISMDCQSGPREILSENYSSQRVVGIVKEKYGVLVEESADEERNIQQVADAILSLVNDEIKMSEYRTRGVERAHQFSNEVYRDKIIALIEGI